MKCGASMFCFQTPFGKRERDKGLSKNCLSESEKNLNKISYTSSCLCLSDTNVREIGVGLELKKLERWRTNTHIGFHMDLLLKSKDRSPKEKFVKNNNKGKEGNQNIEFRENGYRYYDLLTNNVKPVKNEVSVISDHKIMSEEDNKSLVSYSLNPFPTNDIEFIDEPENGLVSIIQDVDDEKKDCKNNDETGNNNVFAGNKNIKSEHIANLNKQKSNITQKAINSEFVQSNTDTCGNFEENSEKDNSVKSESLQNLNEKNDTQIIADLSGNSDVNSKGSSINVSEIMNEPDIDFQISINKKLKQQHKMNSGASFLSFCSLFHLSKPSNENTEKIYSKNNQIQFDELDAPVIFQHNIVSTNFSCCPISSQQVKNVPIQISEKHTKHPIDNIVIINKSPKSKNKVLFSNVQSNQTVDSDCFQCKNGSLFSSDSSSGEASSDGIAPIASPEVISPAGSALSSPKLSGYSSDDVSQEQYNMSDFRDSLQGSNFPSPLSIGYTVPQAKLKLLHEGDIQVCYLNHTRTIISKVLSSKFLRRWETHHIYLNNDFICSKTPTGFLESPVPYSNLDEIYVVGRWDQGNRFCIRLVMADGSLLLQTSNSLVRDQWLSSILWKKNMHKYRNILQTSKRPEVILKEIKSLIFLSLNSTLQDDCVTNVPIEIISKVLDVDEIWNDRQRSEEVIVALAPLLEDSTPSPEMFQFFSRHCLCHPRSPVVIEIFTAIVHRILKRTVDFGKSPLMRRFVADYLKALHSQNDGDEAIRKFVASIHGPSCGCPHPRVLPNLVAVNLAAVFSHFEQRKTLLTESANETNCAQAVQLLDKQFECYITLFLTISEFEDWRPGLAQLLQPIPFPDDALSHEVFIKGFTPVMKKIGMDPRCDVHEMVLGIRENKEGWLNVFCPSSLVCKDEGVLWCQMLKTLFSCCCRRKSFLQKMVKHLGALLLVALRDHAVAQEILCLMLEWRLVNGEDQEMQVVTTLRSTESGRQRYGDLCKRQEHLKELQKKGGPKKLTLPSRSTDADVARLLSCGSFGNLECLSLAFTHVTSACAHQLIQLPALRYLNLWATQFGDAGLIVIAEHLDKLQVLNLCETPVSDKGIAAIAAMRNLKKLNLNSTKLSPQTLDTLKQKLPTLQELDVRYTDAW